MPVIMLAGIERGSETAANRSASHYRRRRALFIDPKQPVVTVRFEVFQNSSDRRKPFLKTSRPGRDRLSIG